MSKRLSDLPHYVLTQACGDCLRSYKERCNLYQTPPKQQTQEVSPCKLPPQDHHEGRQFLYPINEAANDK